MQPGRKMAIKGNPQIQVLVDTVEDTPYSTEQSSLIRRRPESKYKKRCCVQSKAALLILCWNLLLTMFITTFLDPNLFISMNNYEPGREFIPILFSVLAFLYLFYPLAGSVADIRCGRYKSVVHSLWCVFWSGLLLIITVSILAYMNFAVHTENDYRVSMYDTFPIALLIFVSLSASLLTLCFGYTAFNANVIQFGMDQLHDSPSEDSVLFIHWFVFTLQAGYLVFKIIFIVISSVSFRTSIVILICFLIVIVKFLGASLCIGRYNRQWFMIDSGSRNPYKLVYKVIKFAAQHKSPIRRSAFTYCEDELPSRMDLAKEKYGGPFTTEQVEDVKAFLGILCILLTIGPTFTTDIATNNMLSAFSIHLEHNISNYNHIYFQFLTQNGLPAVISTTVIPTYICVLRPFIRSYIPGMLKRIGLGMVIFLSSSISTLLIDTIGHIYHPKTVCFLSSDNFYHYSDTDNSLNITVLYLILPYILNALGYTLLFIAAYEFICAQSPHAMKGLLIGTFFAIKGIFQLIGATAVLIPFLSWNFNISFPSCGFVYYLVNIVIAVIGLLAYTWVARRYQYRQRDEPDNIYRYAEEYYDRDRDQLESTYNYSNNYDDLNVHTANQKLNVV